MRIRLVLTVAAAAGLLTAAGVAVSVAVPAAAAEQACQPSWALVATPAPPGSDTLAGTPVPGGSDESGPGDAGLGSPTVLPTGQAWFTSSGSTSWILNSTGGTVGAAAAQIPPVPDVGLESNASSFDSAADGWVLILSNSEQTGIAERWYGGRWTMVPTAVSPDPANDSVHLASVVSLSPDDAWAVGSLGPLAGSGSGGALIEHWDGASWSIVPNPMSAQAGVQLQGLAAVSADDIWAVGSQGGSAASQTTFAEHWNGSTWATVAVPAGGSGGSSDLSQVSADSSGDVWAVGFQDGYTDSGRRQQQSLAEHWNGTAWSTVTLPALTPAGYTGSLTSVYAAAPDDVWAIDEPAPSTEVADTDAMFVHWNGTDWTAMAAPGPQAYNLRYDYLGIAGSGPDNIWADGFVQNSVGGTQEPVVAHLSCTA